MSYDAKAEFVGGGGSSDVVTAVPVSVPDDKPQAEPPMAWGQPNTVLIDTRVAMRGGQPGGEYRTEKYCGVITILIAVLVFPCVCCCPCDEREVYISPPDGRRIILN